MNTRSRLGLARLLIFLAMPLVAGAGFGKSVPLVPQPPLGARPTFSPAEFAQKFRKGYLLAKVKAGIDPKVRLNAELKLGIRVERAFDHIPGLMLLQFSAAQPVKLVAAKLRASGLYQYVEPDWIVHAAAVPNDPDFGQQWSLNNTGQDGGTPGADIHAEAGWDIQTSASGVIVGIIDSGIRLTHADLSANLWTNPNPGTGGYVGDLHGINATYPSTEPGNGNPDDDYFHGTMVAGVIGAVGNNGVGISGVAWKVQLMALKFISSDGYGSGSGEIACFDYAIGHNVAIINGSFGQDQYDSAEYDAISQAGAAGIIVVLAAGNDGVNADAGYAYPAGYLLDNIVTVAASTSTDTLSSYSNYGCGTVDLAAPGDNIYSTTNRSDTSYDSASGTSFAAPHVVGALALLKATFPADTYRQLINRLLSSADKLPAFSGIVQSGGRLNLAAALGTTGNRPLNDDFANRALLTGSPVRVRSSNAGATVEPGESATIAGSAVTGSLWWTWTAPTTGTYYFGTTSSYHAVVGVFTGGSLSGLTLAGSHDSTDPTTDHLSLSVTAGTAYQIEIASEDGGSGATTLSIDTAPPNDAFASAQLLVADEVASGPQIKVDGTTLYGTAEPGEPNPTGVGAGHSVWYTWSAPAAGHYQLTATSTVVDTVLAVYTGSSLANLTLVGANNNVSGFQSGSLVSFTASQTGQTFYFQVDNTDPTGGIFTLVLNTTDWQVGLATYGISGAPAVAPNGTLYFGTYDANFFAVNPDGTLKWIFQAGGYFDNASPAIGADGTVYIAGQDGVLYGLNGNTGASVLKVTLSTPVSTSIAIGTDGTLYVRDDEHLYSISPSGTVNWMETIDGHCLSSPVVGSNGTIYAGTPEGLQLFDSTGKSLLSFATSSAVDATPAIGSDGTVYVATTDGHVYALTASGSQKWVVTPGGSSLEGFTSSPVLTPLGNILVGDGSGILYVLSSADGSTISSFSTDHDFGNSTPTIGDDGNVYFTGLNHASTTTLSSSDILGSSYVFRCVTTQPITGSPILANGTLYVVAADGFVYASKLGASAAVTPWPMSRQNQEQTGQAPSSLGFAVEPLSQTPLIGSALTLSATATGFGPGAAYQWFKNGSAISGATSATLTLASVAATDTGSYSVTVTTSQGTVSSTAVGIVAVFPEVGKLINLSARADVLTGDNVLIVGFVTSGPSKQVLVRGVGPTLGSLGVPNPLLYPQLTLFDSLGDTLATNSAWGGGSTLANIFNQVGAFSLPPTSNDAALIENVGNGGFAAYTAEVSSSQGTGVGLAEIYDADPPSSSSRLINLSARAYIGTGSDNLIAGFVISGNTPKTVLIRGIGPALGAQSVSGFLQTPFLNLFNASGSVINVNFGWGGEPALAAVMSQVGAFPLPASSLDTVLLVTLAPGAYTALEGGMNGTTGVGLLEVYEVQ